LLLDPQIDGRHHKSRDPRRRYMDAVDLESGLRFRLSRWAPPKSALAFVATIEAHLSKTVSVPIDLGWLLMPGVPRFLAAFETYRRLLLKRRPSEVFCVGAYGGLAPLVAAGRHLDIRVTEAQHGMVDRYHLGYSYPVRPKSGSLDYLPDRLLAWKGDWNPLPDLPCEIERVTSRHWDGLRRDGALAAKRPGLMIVLSQPVIGGRLAQALLERSSKLRRFEIVVKLHPAEIRDPKLRSVFEPLSRQENVRIGENDDLYDLLARAEYQVGVYSTALFEGVELGCRTLLVPLPGIEHMAQVLARGNAELLDSFLESAPEANL
jgi:hypothetical protein